MPHYDHNNLCPHPRTQPPLKLSHLLHPDPLLFLLLLALLLLELQRLLSLADLLAFKLILAAHSNVAGLEVAEQVLEDNLNEPARHVVQDHDDGHRPLELIREGNELHLLIELGHHLGGASKGNGGDTDDAVEHALVLRYRLAERTALIVDSEGGDLLDELKEIDGGVEQRRRELGLKVDALGARSELVAEARNVDEGDDVHGELAEDGADDVKVEDVGLGTLLGETLHRLCAGDGQEADAHEHTADGDLAIAKLDTLQVEDGQTVGANQAVKGENLVHLDGGNESAAALTDDVGNGDNVAELGGERSSDRSITKLERGRLVVIHVHVHHTRGKLVGKGRRLLSRGSLSLLRILVDESLGTSRGDSLDRSIVVEGLGKLLDSDTLLRGLALHGNLVVRVGRSRRVEVSDQSGDRRSGLTPALHEINLLLVHILDLVVTGVFGNADEIFLSTVEESDTNVSLLEGTDIVGTVTSHESVVTHILETEQNVFLLLGRDTSIDPSVAEQSLPADLSLELGQSVTGNAKILGLDDLRIDGLGRVNLNVDLVINAAPDELLLAVGAVLGGIQNENITVNDLDLTGDVDSSKRVISSDHDDTVAALVEHLDGLLSILLERALEDKETGKDEVSLNVLALEVVDLAGTQLVFGSQLLVGESQNTGTAASKVLVGLFVVLGNGNQHLHDRLGRALDGNKGAAELLAGLGIGSVDSGDGALTLQGTGELEAALDLDVAIDGALGARLGLEQIVLAKRPAESSEGSLFHGITNNFTLIKSDKSVGGSQNKSGLQTGFINRGHVAVSTVGLARGVGAGMSEAKSSNTLNNEILASQSTSLIEAGDIDTASEGDSEGLGAEDGVLGKGRQTGVDSQAKLHGQLRGDHRGNDQDAVEQKLGALAVLANTLIPDVPRSGNSEDQKEENEEESLDVVGGDTFGGVDHGANQATLRGFEPGLGDNSHSTVIGRSRDTRGKLGLLLIGVAVSDLEDLGAAPEESVLVKTLGVNLSITGTELNGILQQRRTLARKHGLVDDGGSLDQNHIASNTAVLLCTGNRDKITGEKLVARGLGPLAEAVGIDLVGLDAHAAELVEGALTLPDDGALEYDEHEEGE